MTEQEIAVKEETQESNISLGTLKANSPRALIQGASSIANELADIIKQQNLSVSIQGGHYVRCEGWTTLATLMGILPREVETVQQEEGVYTSTVELVRIENGQVLTRASAECGYDKPWNQRPHYARRSMAQTRATGKACRLAFSWIMSLAGYSATPYEEVQDITLQNNSSQSTQQKQSSSPEQGSGKQAQSQNIGAQLATQKQLNFLNQQLQVLGITEKEEKMKTVNTCLQNKGYEQVQSSKEISKKAMSELLDEIKGTVNQEVEQNNPLNGSAEDMDPDPFAPGTTE